MEDLFGPTKRSLVTYMQIDSFVGSSSSGINSPPTPKKKRSLNSLDVRTFVFIIPYFILCLFIFFGGEGRL